MRAYTGLVGWSVRHKYHDVRCSASRSSPARSTRRSCCPSASCRRSDERPLALRRRAAARLAPRRHQGGDRPARGDACASMPEVRRVFVNGGVQLPGRRRCARRRFTSTRCRRPSASSGSASSRSASPACFARRAGHPLLVTLNDNGQRAPAADRQRARRRPSSSRRRRSCSARWRRSPHLSNVAVDRAARPARDAHRPKPDVAAELGVSTEAISEAVRIATIGDIGANLAKFDVGDRQVPIRVQLDESARGDRQLLESAQGAGDERRRRAALGRRATSSSAQGPTSIDRYDRARRVVIERRSGRHATRSARR